MRKGKRGPGRPRMNAKDRKDSYIRIRLTHAEHKGIRATASAKSLTVSAFLRACAESFLLENQNV